MKLKNDGEYLQDVLQDALKKFSQYHKAFYYRFYDSKSTNGGYLPAQPGDYFLLVPGMCMLIECKSTKVTSPLLTLAHKGEVGKRQIAKHKLWHRAGNPSLYLYGNLANKVLEWHLGTRVVEKVAEPIWRGPPSDLYKSLETIITIAQNTRK